MRKVIALVTISVCVLSFVYLQGCGADEVAEGTLVLNEISPWPTDGEVWVEILNPTEDSLPVGGWSIRFLSGASADLPADAPKLPAGGVILVTFGHRAEAPVLKGKTLRIRVPSQAKLNRDGDGCTLYGPDGPTDSIRWGTLPKGATAPLPCGPPLRPQYEVLMEDLPLFRPGDVCLRIPDTWPPLSKKWVGSSFWAFRSADSASPGRPNPPPGPLFLSPPNGSRVASRFQLSVSGLNWASKLTFQVARDEKFKDIVIKKTVKGHSMPVDNLPPGNYYWRVRGEARKSGPWSTAQEFTILPFDVDELIKAAKERASIPFDIDELIKAANIRMADASELGETRTAAYRESADVPKEVPILEGQRLVAHHVIGINHLTQHKDTDMVCLDGCPEYGDFAWDGPHPVGAEKGGHNEIYCVRACLAMIAALSGCTLSQDRISYYLFEELGSASRCARETHHIGDPLGDLGHGRMVRGHDILPALEWIFGHPGSHARAHEPEVFDDNDPADMDSIRDFIDDGRPVIRVTDRHATIIDGYAIIQGEDIMEERLIRVLDPWTADNISWLSFPIVLPEDLLFIFPPATGRPMRCDEPGVATDSDGDLLVDFDETHRFMTDPNNPDSDDDGLNDRIDMLGYLFDPDGSYNLRDRDMDGDGKAKELDPDNDRSDDNGMGDGCEDTDLDGYFTAGRTETDNFDTSDDFTIAKPNCFSGFIRHESTVGGPGGHYVSTREEITVQPRRPISAEEYAYGHRWELSSTPYRMAIPGVRGRGGGVISSQSQGRGSGRARVTIEIDDSGHYRMVSDCEPRVGTYTITTTGPGIPRKVKNEEIYFACADHHFDYVSPKAPGFVFEWLRECGPFNVFEGEVETTPGGGRRIAGRDVIKLPESLVGLSGSATRSWEIWISPPYE